MPESYNLYPGLKQILEDKRIKQYGVPPTKKDKYLRCESFVVDQRDFDGQAFDDLKATYKDLELLGLHKLPAETIVIHSILERRNAANPSVVIDSVFIDGDAITPLFDTEEKAKAVLSVLNENEEAARHAKLFYSTVTARLITLLATRGVIKEHKLTPSNRLLSSHVHKKGIGGYTIIRPPTYQETGGEETGIHVRPHFRRGHIRKLHPEDKTCWVWVSPCFVNGEPEAQRKAYLVA